MIRRPPRSTRTAHSFPTRRSSDLRKGTTVFDTDEHVRADASLDEMTKLRPAFDKEGSVTAGNASGINDGAAAVVLASQKAVAEKGFKPMGRIIGWGHAGVAPGTMG